MVVDRKMNRAIIFEAALPACRIVITRVVTYPERLPADVTSGYVAGVGTV
jgi:hypothetical protein